MPPSLDNPFRKPPRSKKEAEEISNLLAGEEGKSLEEVQDPKIELSDVEQELADKAENKPWSKEQMEEWAEKHGLADYWVESQLQLSEDGTWHAEGELDLSFITDPEEFPRGISFVGDTLKLNGLKSAKGISLPNVRIVFLNKIEDAQGLIFHDRILRIDLDSLKDSQSLRLPKDYSGRVYVESLSQQQIRDLKKQYPMATFFR